MKNQCCTVYNDILFVRLKCINIVKNVKIYTSLDILENISKERKNNAYEYNEFYSRILKST